MKSTERKGKRVIEGSEINRKKRLMRSKKQMKGKKVIEGGEIIKNES